MLIAQVIDKRLIGAIIRLLHEEHCHELVAYDLLVMSGFICFSVGLGVVLPFMYHETCGFEVSCPELFNALDMVLEIFKVSG